MMRKILYVVAFLVFILCALIFRPIPIVHEKDASEISGIVESIKHTKGDDFVFQLKGNPTKYYINRGTEAGLNFNSFKRQVMDQKILVKYPEYWTPLDWNQTLQHISKVELNGETLFNEFKPEM